jgi:hypothetical protein
VNETPTAPPPGATPIDTDELLAAVGELYVQVRVLRKLLIRSQQQGAMAANGLVSVIGAES